MNHSILERKLGYCFQENALLVQALTHKSAGHKHNERLEYLGDSILNFIIADCLFQQFPSATEGELTRARASLVNKNSLFQVAEAFSLGDFLYLGIGEKRSGGFRRESILADALEAIIGAIYLEGGFLIAKQCVQKWFKERIANLKPSEQEKDPKTRLQEWLQGKQQALPIYEVISIVGVQHEQIFTVSCKVEALSLSFEGSGPTRRIAEQVAARQILESIYGQS